jgi:hypothetical protein
LAGVRHRAEAGRRELEILTPEQVRVGREEREHVHDRHEDEGQGEQVDEERQAGEAQADQH